MASTLAQLDQVSRLFGRFAALRKVSMSLAAGRCYVLLGENGAGKSTLLRVLAGLLEPTLGTARIFTAGQAAKIAEQRARIGYMSHAPMLYDELSAMENLRYFAGLYRTCSCLKPEEALLAVGLDPALTRPVGQYSQGMRQRTSLARVLLPQPELLLLDEPFSNMDAASAGKMVALLGRLRGASRTVVLTTHQRSLAEPLADYFLMMEAGQLVRPPRGRPSTHEDQRRPHPGEPRHPLYAARVRGGSRRPLRDCRSSEDRPAGEQVFKTLLTTTGPDQYAFAVIPGDAELDFKKLARAAGARKAEMVSLRDVQPLTGYIRGGVTVFGAKKEFPVFADETIELFDFISVSAGQRGIQVLLAPQDYLRVAKATVADLTKDQARL